MCECECVYRCVCVSVYQSLLASSDGQTRRLTVNTDDDVEDDDDTSHSSDPAERF